ARSAACRAVALLVTGAVVLSARLAANARARAFLAGPPGIRTDVRMPVLAAAAAAVAVPAAPAVAAYEMPSTGNVAQFFKTVWQTITTGSDQVYDPFSDEGAKALGLAYKLPKDGFEEVKGEDYLPFVLFLVVLIAWGLLVVPTSMDRSDGAKSVLFDSQVPALPMAPVPDSIRLQSPEAPILKSRMLRKADDELLLPVSKGPPKATPTKKKNSGFLNKS
ncbi:unnamed protein product, partial [Polarella glacialis]